MSQENAAQYPPVRPITRKTARRGGTSDVDIKNQEKGEREMESYLTRDTLSLWGEWYSVE